MIRASTVTLLQESPRARGVYDAPDPVQREVACTVQSVYRQEFYAALSQGYTPYCVLILGNHAEYQNERECIFEGQRYRIIRPYIRQDNKIELTIERVVNRDV